MGMFLEDFQAVSGKKTLYACSVMFRPVSRVGGISLPDDVLVR